MTKELDDMTRQELINFYTGELEGSMEDFDGYANKSVLLEAISSIQDLREALSATVSSDFEFMTDEGEEDEVAGAHSDEWYELHNLPIPRE